MGLLLGSTGCRTPTICQTADRPAAVSWERRVEKELPLLGHRNWIVVADSAYPAQISPGVEVIYTGEKALPVIEKVLELVDRAPHVGPVVYLDAELDHVPEAQAKGIGHYREKLAKLLADQKVVRLPHEELIARLDEAGKTFRVLVLKTDLTLPYTSVFLRLDCGYWTPEAEQQLRRAMQNRP